MTVALVGFAYKRLLGLHDAGLPISLSIFKNRLPANPLPGITYIEYDKLHHLFEGAFASDLDDAIANQVRKNAFAIFSRTHYRTFARRADYSFDGFEVANHFENALNFYWRLLHDNQVQHLIFQNAPHGGSSIILYHLAKALGLTTIIFMQSLEPNRFWAARCSAKVDA